jgi:glutathione synthase/RimK-type ligase-like ATP-grasp enzyme
MRVVEALGLPVVVKPIVGSESLSVVRYDDEARSPPS